MLTERDDSTIRSMRWSGHTEIKLTGIVQRARSDASWIIHERLKLLLNSQVWSSLVNEVEGILPVIPELLFRTIFKDPVDVLFVTNERSGRKVSEGLRASLSARIIALADLTLTQPYSPSQQYPRLVLISLQFLPLTHASQCRSSISGRFSAFLPSFVRSTIGATNSFQSIPGHQLSRHQISF